jgi:hypothetical protein
MRLEIPQSAINYVLDKPSPYIIHNNFITFRSNGRIVTGSNFIIEVKDILSNETYEFKNILSVANFLNTDEKEIKNCIVSALPYYTQANRNFIIRVISS